MRRSRLHPLTLLMASILLYLPSLITLTQCTRAPSLRLLQDTIATSARSSSSSSSSSLKFLNLTDSTYDSFVSLFKGKGISRSSDQYTYRQSIYSKNVNKIKSYNQISKKSYLMGINEFADLDETQFISAYAKLILPTSMIKVKKNTTNPKNNSKSSGILGSISLNFGVIGADVGVDSSSAQKTSSSYTTPPNAIIDWTLKASSIVNQGICGSCFAIAPMETIYITSRIYGYSLVSLSFQQILSCAGSANGAYGCDGGYFTAAYEYNRVNGTGSAIMYPYETAASTSAKVSACNTALLQTTSYVNSKFKVRGYGFIPYNDCNALVVRLQTQAVAASISTQNMQFYISGVYTGSGDTPNHGVTVVGYTPSIGYKIKNSWGTSWGLLGYGWVSATTGVCDYSMYPVTGYENTA